MKVSETIDLYLWKHFIPVINPAMFKSKIISSLSLLYISIFPLPRKFLRHYISGKGTALQINTKKIITENPEVFDELIKELSGTDSDKEHNNELKISQLLVSNPNFKYAVGSFSILYRIEGEIVTLRIHSNYHYGSDNNRITRHLHNWMFALKGRGIARDFEIEGSTWTLPFQELSSAGINNSFRKFTGFDRLYV